MSRAPQILETERRWKSAFSPNGKPEMISPRGGASAGQLASIAAIVRATCAGRMLRETSPNESATTTLLRWFGHLFAHLRKGAPLASGQALKTGLRNFFQQRVDLFDDEFFERHLPAALVLHPPAPQRPLHKRRPPEAEQVGIEPAGRGATEPGAMTHHAVAIDHEQDRTDRAKSVAKVFHL